MLATFAFVHESLMLAVSLFCITDDETYHHTDSYDRKFESYRPLQSSTNLESEMGLLCDTRQTLTIPEASGSGNIHQNAAWETWQTDVVRSLETHLDTFPAIFPPKVNHRENSMSSHNDCPSRRRSTDRRHQ
ncbi:hypothetical protein BJ166DRAFT_175525 [Pestalotiopsis sp. NC0098]|nr:hypothetical protein BJ166DRAFT_175525 [Pestalotiopsis sp. NC0098]